MQGWAQPRFHDTEAETHDDDQHSGQCSFRTRDPFRKQNGSLHSTSCSNIQVKTYFLVFKLWFHLCYWCSDTRRRRWLSPTFPREWHRQSRIGRATDLATARTTTPAKSNRGSRRTRTWTRRTGAAASLTPTSSRKCCESRSARSWWSRTRWCWPTFRRRKRRHVASRRWDECRDAATSRLRQGRCRLGRCDRYRYRCDPAATPLTHSVCLLVSRSPSNNRDQF